MQNKHHQCFRAVKAITQRTHRNYQWSELFPQAIPNYTENAARCSVDLEEWDAGGGREVHEGGDIGIHTADSLVVQQKLTTL